MALMDNKLFFIILDKFVQTQNVRYSQQNSEPLELSIDEEKHLQEHRRPSSILSYTRRRFKFREV